jgi:hypothetical protein
MAKKVALRVTTSCVLVFTLGCNGGDATTSPPSGGTGGEPGRAGGSSMAGAAMAGSSSNTAGTSAGVAGTGVAGAEASTGGLANAGGGGAAGGSATAGASGMVGSSGSTNAGGTTAETPGVRIVGRTLPGASATRFGWPGVALHARFSGTQAALQLTDGNNQNAFEVVIDGGAPKKFRTSSGQSSYPLATGLPSGDHELLVWRSTEVFDSGTTDFLAINGFSAGGALLSPPPAATRRIEVIGDSISVGAGLEGGAANCAANKLSTDNYYAYGSVAARAVNADVVTIAYSGIGVYRSYGGNAPTMPERYDRALPDDPTAWDFAKYQPHVVVINLGTNDFGSGDPGQPYVDTYVTFAKQVRAKYADAYFILAAMYGNQEAAVSSVVTALKNGGDARVELLKFSSVQNDKGCAAHPDAAAQKAMGDLLTTRLKAVMSW